MSAIKTAIGAQFRILGRLVWSPEAAFRDLARSGPFLAPLVLSSLLGAAVQFINLPLVERVALNNMAPGMDPDLYQKGLEYLRASQFIGMAATPLSLMIKWSCIAGLIYLVLQVAGGSMPFRQLFSLVAFSSVLQCLESCLAAAILGLKGFENINTARELSPPLGLNLLLQPSGVAIDSFLNNFSLFGIWYLAVLTFGVAYFNRFSRKKALMVVAPVWLFMAGLQAALVALGNSIQPAG